MFPAGALPKPKADQGKPPGAPPPEGISSSKSLSGVAVVPVKLEYVRVESYSRRRVGSERV